MKKIIKRISILAILLIVLDVVFGFIVRQFEDRAIVNNPEAYKFSYTLEYQSADILIVGGSTAARHVNPEIVSNYYGETVYNAGNPGCYLTYQVCLLNLLIDRDKHPKRIIWIIDPNHITDNTTEEEETRSLYHLYRYKEYPYVKNLLEQYMPSMFLYSSFYKYNCRLISFVKNVVIASSDNTNGYLPLQTPKGLFPSKSICYFPSDVNNRKLELFEETLYRIKQNGIKISILTSPRYDNASIINTEQYSQIKAYCSANDIPFIDTQELSAFNNDSTLYYDVCHLNQSGAEKYTEYILPLLDSPCIKEK